LASIQRRCARKSFTEINDLKATAQTFEIDAIKDDRYFYHVPKCGGTSASAALKTQL